MSKPLFSPEAIDDIRGRIKSRELTIRLEDHALGDERVIMTDTQIKAAAILLRKTIPDLTHVDHTSAGGPLQVSIVKFSDTNEDDDAD